MVGVIATTAYPAIDTPVVALEVKNPHFVGEPFDFDKLEMATTTRAFPDYEYTEEQQDFRQYLWDKIKNPRDFEVMDTIALCESHWQNIPNHKYTNENGYHTAFGLFQINKSTAINFSELDRREPFTNIDIAIEIYKKNGTKDWNESKNCWYGQNR